MISSKIQENLKSSSWIRKMFEEGERLRRIYGPDKVYDFTLGNPDPEPPEAVKKALRDLVLSDQPGMHRYMSNAGFEETRSKIARLHRAETGLPIESKHVVMTCGAAGGLNVVLKTILDPGDEVLVFAPFFVEYLFYIDNHGGKAVIVHTNHKTFEPDPEALRKHITPRTKAILLNSPNNPTGVVYREETLKQMAKMLEDKEKEMGTTIYVLSDEPYSKLVYDNIKVPHMHTIFKNSVIVNSFSKSLALPGERIGYIAVNPQISDADLLVDGLVFSNRTLGFVNAPALFQKVITEALDASVDVELYRERRDILYNHITKLGFSCIKPQGAFYLFPKSPLEDDVEFVAKALKYNILLVPGQGFGCPGYFRMSYCVSLETILNSLPAFEALAAELNL